MDSFSRKGDAMRYVEALEAERDPARRVAMWRRLLGRGGPHEVEQIEAADLIISRGRNRIDRQFALLCELQVQGGDEHRAQIVLLDLIQNQLVFEELRYGLGRSGT